MFKQASGAFDLLSSVSIIYGFLSCPYAYVEIDLGRLDVRESPNHITSISSWYNNLRNNLLKIEYRYTIYDLIRQILCDRQGYNKAPNRECIHSTSISQCAIILLKNILNQHYILFRFKFHIYHVSDYFF